MEDNRSIGITTGPGTKLGYIEDRRLVRGTWSDFLEESRGRRSQER